MLEKVERVGDRQVQDVGDRLSFITHLERFAIVPSALTDLARHVHVWQEVHLHLHEPIALTGFATAALHVERDPYRPVPPQLRFGEIGNQLADRCEEARIGRRIGPRRAADRALIDVDHLVDEVQPFQSIMRAGHDFGAVEMARERLIEDIGNECRFPGPRYSCDRDEQAQRELDGQVLQVMVTRAHHAEHSIRIHDPATWRDGNAQLAAQIARREGVAMSQHLVEQAGGDHLATMPTRARAEVYDVVGRANRLLVVLHDEHRVAEVAQLLECGEQPRVIALMQADRRLIQDVQHADESAADLRCETDALRFATGECDGRTIEREVIESDVDEEAQPLGDFLEDRLCDLRVQSGSAVATQGNTREEVERLTHRQGHDIADSLSRNEHRQALRLEPATAAGGTWLLDHELLELFAHGIRCGFTIALLDVIEYALPARLV